MMQVHNKLQEIQGNLSFLQSFDSYKTNMRFHKELIQTDSPGF